MTLLFSVKIYFVSEKEMSLQVLEEICDDGHWKGILSNAISKH